MSHDFARSQRMKKESSGRKKPAPRKSAGVPSWVWVLVGTLVGCFIMFLVYLSGLAPQLPNLKAAQQASQAGTAAPATTAAEPPAPPKRVSPVFEFYTKLPEGGQPVTDLPPAGQPAAGATPPAPVEAPQPAAANPDPIQQLLAEQAAAAASPPAAATPGPETADTAAAKPEATKPAPAKAEAAKPEPAKPAMKGRYLQVGAFRNKAEVDKLRAKISLLGLSPSVQSTTNAKGETLQKVLVGPFSSAESMDDAKVILGGNGISAIPVR